MILWFLILVLDTSVDSLKITDNFENCFGQTLEVWLGDCPVEIWGNVRSYRCRENSRYYALLDFNENVDFEKVFLDSRARFFVEFRGNLRSFFAELSRIYVNNVVVLKNSSFYTYFPYEMGNLSEPDTKPVRISSCSERKTLSQLFPEKLPKSWANTTLKVAQVYVPPYVICPWCVPRGIEFEILDLLKDRLQLAGLEFTGTYMYTNWGTKRGNNYSNAYGVLQNRSAHVGIGMFQMDNDSVNDFDFSFPYMMDRLVFIVPVRNLVLDKLMLEARVWVLVAVSYVAITGILHVSVRKSLGTLFLVTYAALLGVSICWKLPNRFCARLIFLIWCTSTWVLMVDIQSYLMYFLTHERSVKEIDTLQQLAESDLKIGMYVHTSATFQTGTSAHEKRIYQKRVFCNVDNVCMNQTVTKRDIAVIKPSRTIDYEIASKYLDANGDPLLQVVKDGIVMRYVNVCFPRGFPLFPRFDRLLLGAKRAGFVLYWQRWYTNYVNIVHNKNVRKTVSFASKPLTLTHLDGVFKLLMCGLALAFLAFLMEAAKFELCDRRR